jgi:hypothetical protein
VDNDISRQHADDRVITFALPGMESVQNQDRDVSSLAILMMKAKPSCQSNKLRGGYRQAVIRDKSV